MTSFFHCFVTLLVFGLFIVESEVEGRPAVGSSRAKDDDSNSGMSSAQHARTLVHKNVWATLSTISVQFNGNPYGNTVSYSDGIGFSQENSTGKIYFYLTPLDATGADLRASSSASVAITMAQEGLHACKMDVEDPTCWKLTLTGKVVPAPANQLRHAKNALFSKHPQMEQWPGKHGFVPYVLEIKNIVLLDFYGGAEQVSVKEYYQIKLKS